MSGCCWGTSEVNKVVTNVKTTVSTPGRGGSGGSGGVESRWVGRGSVAPSGDSAPAT